MWPGTPGGYELGGWWWAKASDHCSSKEGFKKSLSMSGGLGSLAGDREFRMSDPDRLTSDDDKTFDRDTRGLIVRIIVVALLAVVFWHTVVVARRL